jgi:hypothetical protein
MNEKMKGLHVIEITCIEEKAFWHEPSRERNITIRLVYDANIA